MLDYMYDKIYVVENRDTLASVRWYGDLYGTLCGDPYMGLGRYVGQALLIAN